jgi:hypothetical protein
MGYSHEISTPRERAGQQLQAKIPLLRKSYSLFLQVMLQKGIDEVGEDYDG